MAMKRYCTLLKALELDRHHQIQFSVIPRTLVGRRVFYLCRGAVSLFYSPRRLDRNQMNDELIYNNDMSTFIENIKDIFNSNTSYSFTHTTIFP